MFGVWYNRGDDKNIHRLNTNNKITTVKRTIYELNENGSQQMIVMQKSSGEGR